MSIADKLGTNPDKIDTPFLGTLTRRNKAYNVTLKAALKAAPKIAKNRRARVRQDKRWML